jgi:SAM-dependent methyltransferase
MTIYGDDLAYIHDAGFSEYALRAAPELIRELKRSGIAGGLVVDLGCGSGRLAHALNRAGYEVLGVDQSPALVKLARHNAPNCRFELRNLHAVRLPPCNAVISIGECVNYSAGRSPGQAGLRRLFKRVHRALSPGGIFVFDAATPERILRGGSARRWLEGADWAVLVESSGKPGGGLSRRIILFRKTGANYRRSEEVHRLRLYEARTILQVLRECGFHAEQFKARGRWQLPVGIVGFLARKKLPA